MKETIFKIFVMSWLMALTIIIVKGVDKMAHENAYLVCENMCLVEGYSKEQTDKKLNDKSNTGHKHSKSDITDFSHTHTKSQITDFNHNHDDRYYTESESDARYVLKDNVQNPLITQDIYVTVSAGSTSGTAQVAYPTGITRDDIAFVGCQFKADGTSIWNYGMGNLSGSSNKDVSIITTQDSTFLLIMSLASAPEQDTMFVVRLTMTKVNTN